MLASRNHQGYSLIELMVSIAIIGILTAIVVGSFSQQKNISLARRAAEKLSGDLQAVQNNALSGQAVNGSRPAGFGLYAALTTPSQYIQFADSCASGTCSGICTAGSCTTSQGNGVYASGEGLRTTTFDSTITLVKLNVSGTNSSGVLTNENVTSNVNIAYSVPSAAVSLVTSPALTQVTTPQQVSLTIKNSKLKICYAVSVSLTSGTVSSRSLATCP